MVLSLKSLRIFGSFRGRALSQNVVYDNARRWHATAATPDKESRSIYILLTGLLGTFGGLTWLLEEREVQNAVASLERGSRPSTSVGFPEGKLLQRRELQDRLQDLLGPYVCSMSHIDIIFGHEGIGKTEQVKQACRQLHGGTLYIDLQGANRLGSQIFVSLTGDRHRGLFQSFRDFLRGGVEAHGVQVLERAAHMYVKKHERYPVIAIDHVDPVACNCSSPASPLLNLGRAYTSEEPSMRSVLVMNDAQLESLRQEAEPSTSFRVVAMDDASAEASRSLLLRNNLPSELVDMVVPLVGGRLRHLQEAIQYWSQSSRWLSPMRADSSQQDLQSAAAAHFAEIKKLIYWDLDKKLRIQAGIGLWPAATGDAPVSHQKPTDEDAVRILALLEKLDSGPLPSETVRQSLGEERLLQLLGAQVLGYMPAEGPLDNLSQDLIGFGSPAMHAYFKDRLQQSRVAAVEAALKSKKGSTSWTHHIFG